LSDMSCLMISEVFNFIFMNQSSREAETFWPANDLRKKWSPK
jgi:hypothetical protein